MRFNKIKLDDLERAYSVGIIHSEDPILLVASEKVDGSCFAYNLSNLNKTTVWENQGGTMSLVEIPNTKSFLATVGFFPGFNAKSSKVVKVVLENGKVTMSDVINIPYLHRFDLLFGDDQTPYFIGATLCENKTEREDWSTAGKIYIGQFENDFTTVKNLKVVKDGLFRNHGYYRAMYQGVMSSFITSDQGVDIVIPPHDGKDFEIIHLIDEATSDIALIDIDQDGQDEFITIAPFHSKFVKIFKEIDGELKVIYEYKRETDFVHALAGGQLNGQNAFVVGSRRVDKELFVITYDVNQKQFIETFIEEGVGSSNVLIVNTKDKDYIFSANNGNHEVALYEVLND